MALRKVLSAFGKLGIVALVAIAFAFGLLLTVYLSLRSPNIPVPDVAGKPYLDGEAELARAGLDIRERAKRYKPDVPPGVIIDQSPRPGEIIKAGQTVAVVVSRPPKEGEKPPDEAVAEERREERGTEAIVENKNGNQNRERRRTANRNANSNSNAANNSNAASNTNGGNTSNSGPRNTNSGNSNAGRANSNANANRPRTTNSNSRNANSGGPRNANAARPATTNRRPNP